MRNLLILPRSCPIYSLSICLIVSSGLASAAILVIGRRFLSQNEWLLSFAVNEIAIALTARLWP